MTAHRAVALTLIFASTLVVSACSDDGDAGPTVAQTRAVGSFDAIDLEGAARIEIRVGQPASLTVEGRRAAVQRVATEVRDGTLHVDSKPKRWFGRGGRSRITLKIALPQLSSLKLEGGNDVRLTGFDGGKSSIDVTGAAHIRANGRLDELTVRLAGAGRADLSKLVTNAAKVTVDGVGSVTVSPQESLDATVNGVGAIYYTGSPANVNTHMNGLGTISRREGKDAADTDDAEYPPEDADEKSTVVI